MTKRPRMGVSGWRGGRLMASGSVTSKARGSDRATDATRLIHRSWVGSMGISGTSSPSMSSMGKKATAAMRMKPRPRLVGRTKASDLMRLS